MGEAHAEISWSNGLSSATLSYARGEKTENDGSIWSALSRPCEGFSSETKIDPTCLTEDRESESEMKNGSFDSRSGHRRHGTRPPPGAKMNRQYSVSPWLRSEALGASAFPLPAFELFLGLAFFANKFVELDPILMKFEVMAITMERVTIREMAEE